MEMPAVNMSASGKVPVSVIVPVYKAERYIDTCMKTLLAQTFTDFEVILVDDGSPDGSGAICDGYARIDSRVKVIHKENGGVSSARQCGIENSCGEYTVHVDPDDWVEPDMIGSMYMAAIACCADIAVCDYVEECHGRSKYRKQEIPDDPAGCVRMLLTETLHSACWNKLIRRSLYTDNSIGFPSGVNMWEDMATVPRLFACASKVAYVPRALYHYVRYSNPNALTRDTSFAECMKRMRVVETLRTGFGVNGTFSGYLPYLELKVRTALLRGSQDGQQLKEAMECYPESGSVVWKHPTMSFYAKITAWASCSGHAGLCVFLLNLKRLFKPHSAFLHVLHDV